MEEPIVSEALVEVPTKSKVLKTAALEETSGMEAAEVGMAPPQMNCSPSLPPRGAKSTKPAGGYTQEEPNCSLSFLHPVPLRFRRGEGNLAAPRDQEVAMSKIEAGTSGGTTQASLGACGGQHGATGIPAPAQEAHFAFTRRAYV